jgi:hypothetical protein
MRKSFLLAAALAMCATWGACNDLPPDSVLRAEITPEELNAPPDYHQMKGALLNDVRIWRRLELIVDTEGRREVPIVIKFAKGVAVCSNDETEFEIYRLKEDLLDQPYRVDETAYLCRKDKMYYYRYQGGPKKLDVWLGPYRIERRRPAADDQQKK